MCCLRVSTFIYKACGVTLAGHPTCQPRSAAHCHTDDLCSPHCVCVCVSSAVVGLFHSLRLSHSTVCWSLLFSCHSSAGSCANLELDFDHPWILISRLSGDSSVFRLQVFQTPIDVRWSVCPTPGPFDALWPIYLLLVCTSCHTKEISP